MFNLFAKQNSLENLYHPYSNWNMLKESSINVVPYVPQGVPCVYKRSLSLSVRRATAIIFWSGSTHTRCYSAPAPSLHRSHVRSGGGLFKPSRFLKDPSLDRKARFTRQTCYDRSA